MPHIQYVDDVISFLFRLLTGEKAEREASLYKAEAHQGSSQYTTSCVLWRIISATSHLCLPVEWQLSSNKSHNLFTRSETSVKSRYYSFSKDGKSTINITCMEISKIKLNSRTWPSRFRAAHWWWWWGFCSSSPPVCASLLPATKTSPIRTKSTSGSWRRDPSATLLLVNSNMSITSIIKHLIRSHQWRNIWTKRNPQALKQNGWRWVVQVSFDLILRRDACQWFERVVLKNKKEKFQ